MRTYDRFLVSIIKVLGWTLRQTRLRGRHLVAALLHRALPGFVLTYRDTRGYLHTAWMGDEMQALGFVGKPSLSRELWGIVGRGEWVIDVGANVGITTAQLCAMVGDRGTVWAIEPFPPNLVRLQELKDVNHIQQLEIFAGALSDHGGRTQLGVPADGSSGHGSLVLAERAGHAVEIAAWSLDDLVRAQAPGARLSFIKIDVEGHESRVLKGAFQTLHRHRPAILCEFNEVALAKADSTWADLLDQFKEFGYQPIAAFKEGRLMRRVTAPAVHDALRSGGGVIDLLFLHLDSREARSTGIC